MSKRKRQIEAYFQQACQSLALGRAAEAEQAFRAILGAEPRHAGSLHMLGVAALQSGRPVDALPWFDRAIGADAAHAQAHADKAHALLALGRPDAAEAAARAALRHKRNSAEARQVLGRALADQGRIDEALAEYREAARLNPRLPDIRNDMGMALADASRLDEAIAELEAAARLAPGDTLTEGNLASALKERGRLDEAERLYRGILARAPGDALARFNLSVLLLLAGRHVEAWPEWEARFAAEPGAHAAYAQPLWRGEKLAGRRLLVHAEQGLGDTIQFARYFPLLPRDGSVAVRVQAPLAGLLSPLAAHVASDADPVPPADIRVPAMSLPLALGLAEPRACPTRVPYISADRGPWAERVAALPGLKVGLCWTGNPARARMDRRRSIPLARLAPLLDVPGASFVSLSKGARVDPAFADRIADWTPEIADFRDSAALVAALDVIVSVDTAAAHLAGAMGKPVWLLNRADTCWRWGLGRDDSDWYPTLRQFRQDAAGDWDAPVARAAAALAERARA